MELTGAKIILESLKQEGVEVIFGLPGGAILPTFDALYSRHLNPHRAGRQWGAWEAVRYFSLAIGAAIGGFIVVQFGFNMLFLTMALLCFASALYIFRLPSQILS